MKKIRIIISLVSITVLVSSLFLPAYSYAYSFYLPAPGTVTINVNEILREVNTSGISSVASLVENRYGFNSNIWRTARRKVPAPRVEIFFDNTNPKAGEKVTAHAVPEFFKNDPQNLYYTWYIIHTRDGRIQTAINSISDGKKEAASIIAHGDYDPDLDGQTYADINRDPDNDGWPAVDANSYDENKTAAPMGGADGVGGLTEEAVEAFSSSTEWCDSLGSHSWDTCSYNDSDAFKPLDTYFTFASSQTKYYCKLCENYFSSGGLSAYNTAKSTRNTCCYNNITSLDCFDGEGNPIKCPYDANTDYCGVAYNPINENCYLTFGETNKSIASYCLNTEFKTCKSDWETIHEDRNNDGFSDFTGEATSRVSRCYRHNFGTNTSTSIFRENELSSSFTSNSSGLDFPVSCKHKWPNAPGYKSGSGKFPNGEEKYWKTDPTDPDTDGDGFPDEADVIGLGQDNFTWNYQPGDRVGVVVEGTSMIPIEELSAYYKIMWGYPDVCDSTKVGLIDSDECDGPSDYGFGFLATKSPSEQGEDKLKVSLSFSPDNPLADPSTENSENILSDGTIVDADQITVTSSLDNSEYNPANLYYTWQISKGDPQKDDWSEIKDVLSNFNTLSPTSGMGITQFIFSPKKDVLSKDSEINYFKVTLTVNKVADQKEGRGRSSVIIPVNTKGIKISLHKVDVVNGKAVAGEEICNEGLYRSLCPAVKGQMLAAKVSGSYYKDSDSQFYWKINGIAIYPPPNSSDFFEGWSNTTVFFPITKEEQEIENISVTATPRDELHPATGTRLITVVRPALFIKSGNLSLSWPKVYEIEDPDRKTAYQNIESTSAFEAFAGNKVPYYLDFVPYYLLSNDSNSTIDWSVNGTSVRSVDFYENNPNLGLIELENSDRIIKLPIGETEGSYTSLSASVKKYWSDDERLISYATWGIAPDTLKGESSVSIEAVNPEETDVLGAASTPGQILAAVGTHLPHYFMYILRLVLIITVMFVASTGLYSLTQRLSLVNEKE